MEKVDISHQGGVSSSTRRSNSTSPTVADSHSNHHRFSKPFRGLKRILFGKSDKYLEQQQEKTMESDRPRARSRAEVSSSDDDEGVILSENNSNASGPVFLPAFSRQPRAREGQEPSASQAVAAKVRHSSSHRSLSSQSSEKEEGYASSRASHGSRESIDLDSLGPLNAFSSNSSNLLANDASKHRIAVRPKRRHTPSGTNQLGSAPLDLPSLKEEPGYLSNAAYTPAPFVVNQQSITQQLSATSAAVRSKQPVNLSTTPSAPKVMKQTTSAIANAPSSSSPPSAAASPMEISAKPSPISSGVPRGGVKLPGFEPTALLMGSSSLAHKPSFTRPSAPVSAVPSQPTNQAGVGVGSPATTDDELTKVLSRLRKVNTSETDQKTETDSNGNLPPVVLRNSVGDKPVPAVKPQILPKPASALNVAKNRQTVCLASLPFASDHVASDAGGIITGITSVKVPVAAPSPVPVASNHTTSSFPKSNSLNFNNNATKPPSWVRKSPSPPSNAEPNRINSFQLNSAPQSSNV